jgi:hypothetical protein
VLQRDEGKHEIERTRRKSAEIRTLVVDKAKARFSGMEPAGQLDHPARHVNTYRRPERLSKRTREPPDTAAKIEGDTRPERKPEFRETTQVMGNVSVARGKKFVAIPADAAAASSG